MEYEKYYWLNEDSRTFLSRGYISETPEQRIKDVANTAERYLKIEGFAKKFEEYMAKGFYSLSTPVWIMALSNVLVPSVFTCEYN